MVDQDEIDEDIFADLYTDAEKPPQRSAPVVKTEEPSPAGLGSVNTAPAPATEPVAESRDNYQHGHSGEATNPNDAHMQGSDWNGNGNQAYDTQPVEQEDNYGPINVKEDG